MAVDTTTPFFVNQEKSNENPRLRYSSMNRIAIPKSQRKSSLHWQLRRDRDRLTLPASALRHLRVCRLPYAGNQGTVESNVHQRTADYPDEWHNGHLVMPDTEELVTVRWEQVRGKLGLQWPPVRELSRHDVPVGRSYFTSVRIRSFICRNRWLSILPKSFTRRRARPWSSTCR